MINWTSGLLTFEGTTYSIAADSTDKKFIYWDPNYTTILSTTDNLQDVFDCEGWLMCINDEGTPRKIMGIPGLHAGILQARTITADGAQIANLTVDTLQIVDNAVTGRVFAYTDGAIAFGADEVVIQTCSFTTTGQPLFIVYVSAIKKTSGVTGFLEYYLRLYRDDEKIFETIIALGVTVYVPGCTFLFEDTPSIGTYNYEVRCQRKQVVGGLIKNRALYINELKK